MKMINVYDVIKIIKKINIVKITAHRVKFVELIKSISVYKYVIKVIIKYLRVDRIKKYI